MVCKVVNTRGARHSSLSLFEQMIMSRGLCDAFECLELGEHTQSRHKPQAVHLFHFVADSNDPNLAFDEATLTLLAHRALIHGQYRFNLAYASEQERAGFAGVCSSFGELPHRAHLTLEKRWFSSIVSAELFAQEYNIFSRNTLVDTQWHNGVHLSFSYAFMSNMHLHNCNLHRCDLFDTLCSCCGKMRWQFPSTCHYSGNLRCDRCELASTHGICATHHRFQQALWVQNQRLHARMPRGASREGQTAASSIAV